MYGSGLLKTIYNFFYLYVLRIYKWYIGNVRCDVKKTDVELVKVVELEPGTLPGMDKIRFHVDEYKYRIIYGRCNIFDRVKFMYRVRAEFYNDNVLMGSVVRRYPAMTYRFNKVSLFPHHVSIGCFIDQLKSGQIEGL